MIIRIIKTIVPPTIALHPYNRERGSRPQNPVFIPRPYSIVVLVMMSLNVMYRLYYKVSVSPKHDRMFHHTSMP